MILHRLLPSRSGPRGPGGSAVRFVRAMAIFGLSILLGGLVLPVLSLVVASEPAPSCCPRGRCCCADPAPAGDERTCVRRGCSCGHPQDAVGAEPLRPEAVLPMAAPVPAAGLAKIRWPSLDEQPVARADQPPAPPPRRSLRS